MRDARYNVSHTFAAAALKITILLLSIIKSSKSKFSATIAAISTTIIFEFDRIIRIVAKFAVLEIAFFIFTYGFFTIATYSYLRNNHDLSKIKAVIITAIAFCVAAYFNFDSWSTRITSTINSCYSEAKLAEIRENPSSLFLFIENCENSSSPLIAPAKGMLEKLESETYYEAQKCLREPNCIAMSCVSEFVLSFPRSNYVFTLLDTAKERVNKLGGGCKLQVRSDDDGNPLSDCGNIIDDLDYTRTKDKNGKYELHFSFMSHMRDGLNPDEFPDYCSDLIKKKK